METTSDIRSLCPPAGHISSLIHLQVLRVLLRRDKLLSQMTNYFKDLQEEITRIVGLFHVPVDEVHHKIQNLTIFVHICENMKIHSNYSQYSSSVQCQRPFKIQIHGIVSDEHQDSFTAFS